MIGDFDIYGVYVPSLLVLMLLTFGASLILRRVLAMTGIYRLVWHRALFDVALYVILLGVVTTLTQNQVS